MGEIIFWIKRALAFVHDGLFPDYCAGCGKEGHMACVDCWGRIPFVPKARQADDLAAWSVADFHDPTVRGVVHALKYGQRAEAVGLIRQAISRWPLAGTLSATSWRLVPVPMHARRKRERGANQAETLAQVLSDLGWGRVDDVLVRVRHTKSQTKLDRAGRLQNVKGAFAVRSGVDPHASYLVIDDVTTTGASLKEAANVLRASGATRVAAWTFAAD